MDVDGQVVVGLRRRVRECHGVVVVLEVGAGLPLPVLPEVLFPARDAEQLDEQSRILAVLVKAPAGGPGPPPRLPQTGHGLQELLLLFGRDGVGGPYKDQSAAAVGADEQLWLGPAGQGPVHGRALVGRRAPTRQPRRRLPRSRLRLPGRRTGPFGRPKGRGRVPTWAGRAAARR